MGYKGGYLCKGKAATPAFRLGRGVEKAIMT